jgi:hypothetical protein
MTIRTGWKLLPGTTLSPSSTVIDQIEHGHHVFRAYWKNAFLKQYEKFSTFLRNELCSNNLCDFGLKKGLEHLEAVREKFLAITDRFAGLQAQWLNVHVDFPLLQRIGLPITIGSVHYAGIKIHETCATPKDLIRRSKLASASFRLPRMPELSSAWK